MFVKVFHSTVLYRYCLAPRISKQVTSQSWIPHAVSLSVKLMLIFPFNGITIRPLTLNEPSDHWFNFKYYWRKQKCYPAPILVKSNAVGLTSMGLNVLLASILVWCSARNCFVDMQMKQTVVLKNLTCSQKGEEFAYKWSEWKYNWIVIFYASNLRNL